jgi:eukaryotic-like serine/threonine-protein kinase
MATVHLARATDRRHGPPLVAIKRPHRHLQCDKTFLTMLVDEARLASSIRHPNVVRVHELGFDGGMPFIVMDYVEGASLADLRKELSAIGRAVDARLGLRMILDALAGLHAAHELKDESGKPLRIVHRDVSPHNVLVSCDGRAHLTDFGIAQAEDRIQQTRTHEVKGKLAYLAPERVDKRRMCTVQSDVFAMAVVLWECFAGRRLFRGEDAVDVLQEVISGPIPTLAQIGGHVPSPVDDVLAKALSRDLEVRHKTALEFAQALERAAGPDGIGAQADVARLMEALFGKRMAVRQERVREAIGQGQLTDLLRESGLPDRPRVLLADVPTGQLLAELAPPAPSGRYALGTDLRVDARSRRFPLWAVAAVAAGSVLGAAVTLAVVANGKPATRASPSASAVLAPPPPASHRVVVPLPFPATRVTFDEVTRDFSPPTDTVTFDVPHDGGARHRLTAIGADGTVARAFLREVDGIAQPDGEGFAFDDPAVPVPASADVRPASVSSSPSARALGEVRNGFTKLR